MRRIAFFDLDGTLCNSHGNVLPTSIEAIRKFRHEGNLAFICTGRSKPEILDNILSIGFDGVIGAGGGFITINNELVFHQKLDKEIVFSMIEYFKENDIGYYIESNDGLFGSDNYVRKIQEEIKKIATREGRSFEELNQQLTWFYELVNQYDSHKIDYSNINKISFINNTVPYEVIKKKFGATCHLYHGTVSLFGPESGEIAVKGVDKERAVMQVLELLKIEKEAAIAFGDGDNDLAMFEAVGYKVAMGNGTEKLKKMADEITDTADNNGIATSFERGNWIK
ncbi:HAD family hydrolase [Vagococcus carniphilus]|uniref:HAD family hydrolase n=1 Tax=Vagococcus carniphilus TaxID=218144 RepID=UPI00288DA4B6|nr:HAD family hydrolase [Vagococcus carniphilus]MDT2865883.1 HAD family hydrolase [Vagococcus carniphilus]